MEIESEVVSNHLCYRFTREQIKENLTILRTAFSMVESLFSEKITQEERDHIQSWIDQASQFVYTKKS